MNNLHLITKYLNQEATGKELEQLQQWISESDSNKTQFAELKNSHAFISSKLVSGKKKSDFNNLNLRLRKFNEQKISLKKIYRIAATILFPILTGLSGWLLYHQFNGTEETLYTEVIAPPKHNSQVILSDGTQVWLSPESKLTYEQNFGKINRNVKLEGEGYFEVTHNNEKPFIVETKCVDIKVLGTSFNIEAYPEDLIIKTTLVRGSVEIKSDKLKNTTLLTPGDKFTLDVANNTASIEKVNTEIYRLVKDGVLIFKRNNLTEVCRKLERWYMVPIEYDGSGDKKLLFTAKFEDESLERILQIVSKTIPINYQIRNDKIIIKYKE